MHKYKIINKNHKHKLDQKLSEKKDCLILIRSKTTIILAKLKPKNKLI